MKKIGSESITKAIQEMEKDDTSIGAEPGKIGLPSPIIYVETDRFERLPETSEPSELQPIPKLSNAPGLRSLRSATAHHLADLMMSTYRGESEGPVPSREGIHHLRIACFETIQSLSPATSDQIGEVIEMMRAVYPSAARSERQVEMLIEVWMGVFADWPADILRVACRAWWMSSESFFPAPGQLVPFGERILRHRQLLARRAQQLSDIMGWGL
jgi:Loader and inhibitor of phage G40P